MAVLMVISLASCREKVADTGDITLYGYYYTLPLRMSTLLADGWSMERENFSLELQPKSFMKMQNCKMKDKNGNVLEILSLYNDSSDKMVYDECILLGLGVEFNENSDEKTFAVPGEINAKSTKSEIIETFGECDGKNSGFKETYISNGYCTYEKQKDTGYTYSFRYNDDGETLNLIEFSMSTDSVG